MKTCRYFIMLSFDGSRYSGWQLQRNAPGIQSEVDRALSTLLREEVLTTGAGRTDTGVHARMFFAHFDCGHDLCQAELSHLTYKLNRILPHDIAAHGIYRMHDGAHARFDALSRTYQYWICTKKDPFMHGRAWLMERGLDVHAMQEAANLLLLHDDFSSFSKSGSQTRTNLCRVMQASWSVKDHLLVFEIKADRFLRNMVRAITGTLVDVGLGKLKPPDAETIIMARDRRKAGYSAPGHGLYLTAIEYPYDIAAITAADQGGTGQTMSGLF